MLNHVLRHCLKQFLKHVFVVLFPVLFHGHVFWMVSGGFQVGGTLKDCKTIVLSFKIKDPRKNLKMTSEVGSRVNFGANW